MCVCICIHICLHTLSSSFHLWPEPRERTQQLISRAPITVTITDMLFIAIVHTPLSPHILA